MTLHGEPVFARLPGLILNLELTPVNRIQRDSGLSRLIRKIEGAGLEKGKIVIFPIRATKIRKNLQRGRFAHRLQVRKQACQASRMCCLIFSCEPFYLSRFFWAVMFLSGSVATVHLSPSDTA